MEKLSRAWEGLVVTAVGVLFLLLSLTIPDNPVSVPGAAGLLGNLQAESGLNPRNLQNSYEKKLGMSDEEYRQMLIRTFPDTAKEEWEEFVNIARKASFSRSEISDAEVRAVYGIFQAFR